MLGVADAARAQTGASIAAVVNDDVVTSQDVADRINLVLATSGIPDQPQTRDRLEPQVLRGVIDERLQLQEAARLDLGVSERDIDEALATIAERNRLDLGALKQVLSERNVPDRVLRDQLRAQIGWAKVVSRELRPRVVVTQDQVELALKDDGDRSGDTELQLAEIMLPVDGRAQQAQVLAQARDLVATVRGGADFAALARQVSVAASAEAGGDLGWTRASTILPEVREIVLALNAGEVADPIVSPSGVSIFQLRAKRVPGEPVITRRLIVTRVDLAQVVLPLAADASRAQLQEAEQRAASLRSRFASCADVERNGPRLAGEGSGRIGWLAISDLPPVLRQLVGQLEPGKLSAPFRGPVGVQMLVVCDRDGREEVTETPAPPPPPPPTPQTARARLEREQLDRLATRYMRDLRQDAFIEVRS